MFAPHTMCASTPCPYYCSNLPKPFKPTNLHIPCHNIPTCLPTTSRAMSPPHAVCPRACTICLSIFAEQLAHRLAQTSAYSFLCSLLFLFCVFSFIHSCPQALLKWSETPISRVSLYVHLLLFALCHEQPDPLYPMANNNYILSRNGTCETVISLFFNIFSIQRVWVSIQ